MFKRYNPQGATQATLILSCLLLFFATTPLHAQLPNLPAWKINRWNDAGVNGGIPSIPSSFNSSNSVTVTTKTNAGIQSAIATAKSANKSWVYLPNGNYNFTGQVNMEPGISLVGQSRSGVKIYIKFNGGNGISFYNDNNCGIYRMTINGRFPKPGGGFYVSPTNKWGCSSCNELPAVTNNSVKINQSSNCWIDDVTINNSGRHPIVLGASANHNTVRNCYIKGAFNKGGGANGYFFIMGKDNLITQCGATQIRHISIQGTSAEFNVVYDNNFEQEVSFHAKDKGNNLIEKNTITLPSDMPDRYYAIMGTWSTDHDMSLNDNYLNRNNCIENNHGGARLYGGQWWWSSGKVFKGPLDGKKEAVAAGRSYDHTQNFDAGFSRPSGVFIYTSSSSSRLARPQVDASLAEQRIQVYPNPVARIVNLVLPREMERVEITLFDLLGKEIYSVQELDSQDANITFKLGSEVKSGVYILVAQDGSATYTTRLWVDN